MTTFRNTWVDIDLDRLTSNIKILKKTSGKSIFGVIKANAYGHGDIEIARQLERLEVSYLCVSSLDEAVHLRNHDIKAPIMVLGYTETEHLSIAINREITCIIPSKEWLEEALAQNNMLDRLKLHIKIDSGMNRVGLKTISELKEVIHIARGHNLNIEGLYTHLSSSNIEDGAITKKQIEKFSQFKNSAEISFKWVHTSNSDAALSLGELDNISNAIRCGIAMYGYSTFEKGLDPILSMYCGINQVAVLPIGYADGLDRKLQGYEFIVNGVACEVVGRVCMDLTMIRVPDYTTSKDIVEIIGKFGDAAKMAKYLQTISYEILTSISPRITRHYLLDGKVVKISNERFD
jgi:alanine racemase